MPRFTTKCAKITERSDEFRKHRWTQLMKYDEQWELKDPLGEGGQGKVYLAFDRRATKKGQVEFALLQFLNNLAGSIASSEVRFERAKELRSIILEIIEAERVECRGALKILHAAGVEGVAGQAQERMLREMAVMAQVSHSSCVRILDSYPEEYAYVSEYYPNGTLKDKLGDFSGDLLRTLKHIRPMVEAVAELHSRSPQVVHRDIKPENIFIAADGRLVLGDFGIAYFKDPQHTRVSETLENVGSRDWMPAWAMGQRVEDISPAFDVFSLGKVIWSMLSGEQFLRLWYFDRPEFDVEKLFPKAPFIGLANPLFRKCMVENEENCLKDAGELLEEIDLVIDRIDKGSDFIDGERTCRTCGRGTYQLKVDRSMNDAARFGLQIRGHCSFKIFACSNCGDVRLFHFDEDKDLPAWPSRSEGPVDGEAGDK